MSTRVSKFAISIVLVALVLMVSTSALAQKQALPKYDAKTEMHISKAIVQDTKLVTLPNGQERFRLIVKAGEQTYEVCLCPKAFLESMDTAFAKGDEVEITGSKVADGENTIILAREVVKGNNTLVLRDKTGDPVWSWMEKKTAEGK